MVALRLQRASEAAIRLGVGKLELGPRLAQLSGAPPVESIQKLLNGLSKLKTNKEFLKAITDTPQVR